jgi:excisionase family DNA binding protein
MSGVETQHVLTRSRVRTVAERNGVSESTVWRLIRAGKLTAHRVGRRITLIDDAEVDRVFGGASQTISVRVRKVSA